MQTAVLNLQAKVALLDVSHVNAIGAQLQVTVHTFRYRVLDVQFYTEFFGRGKKFVGYCHSIMHEYETYKFSPVLNRDYQVFWGEGGGDSRAPLCMKA